MGKITVKHYLNTNLKPYVINKENYYSIYMLVTVNRKNTKIKSLAFSEYYSEKDFEEIINPNNKEDFELLRSEADTITKIIELLNTINDDFDTTLFAAIYNYFPEIYVFEIDLESIHYHENGKKYVVNLYKEDKNKLNINISDLFQEEFSLKENQAKGMSVYTFFSPMGQFMLKKLLKKSKPLIDININDEVDLLTSIVFYRTFEKLDWILRGNNKYSKLLDKYCMIFDLAVEYWLPIYKKISVQSESNY